MKRHSALPKPVKRHAYGSKVQTKWNGGDYATVGLDTAGGILGGMATGAALGTVGGPIGIVAGGVIGGLVGLGKGLLGSSAKAKQRAQLKEANRQQTMQNMESRLATDSNVTNYSNVSPSFYLKGGRIHMMGSSIPNMKSTSSNTELAVGPSHENGGIQYGPNDEIEGGETTMKQANEVLVFSNRLKVPGTNKSFAKLTNPLMIEKGNLEKQLDSILKDSERQVEKLNIPTLSKIQRNSSIRRGDINSLKAKEKLSQIGTIESVLQELFKVQEQLNGNDETNEQGEEQHALGGTITDEFYGTKMSKLGTFSARVSQPGTLVDTLNLKDMGYRKGSAFSFKEGSGTSGVGLQYLADGLDTVSQAISSYQMSKLPLPNRSLMPRIRFNSTVDNSKDINDIETMQASTKKFINDNVRNPQIRRAMMIDLATKMNTAKSTSFMNKFNAEREIENKNTELAFQSISQNNNIAYQNAVDKFNQTTSTYTRNSQIAANFADKVAQVGLNREKEDQQYVSLGLMLSQYPEGVRKNILNNLKNGKSLKQSIVG